jgi:hypothetical protein
MLVGDRPETGHLLPHPLSLKNFPVLMHEVDCPAGAGPLVLRFDDTHAVSTP